MVLSPLFPNLGALRIERVETVAASANLSLLGFFYGTGIAPAQRLAFVKTL